MKTFTTLLFLSILSMNIYAQEEKTIRLSGLVMEMDSLKPVPFASVYVLHSTNGVISDQIGLFGIDVMKNDTVVFSRVGKETTYFVVPDTMSSSSYSIIQKMPSDTIQLKVVEITSWPSIEQFNQVFTDEYGFGKDARMAQKNASPLMNQIDYSHDVDTKKFMEMNGSQYTNVYLNAHIPLGDVLNPKRWDKLVENWKQGKTR